LRWTVAMGVSFLPSVPLIASHNREA